MQKEPCTYPQKTVDDPQHAARSHGDSLPVTRPRHTATTGYRLGTCAPSSRPRDYHGTRKHASKAIRAAHGATCNPFVRLSLEHARLQAHGGLDWSHTRCSHVVAAVLRPKPSAQAPQATDSGRDRD